jgi:hypothetical protein
MCEEIWAMCVKHCVNVFNSGQFLKSSNPAYTMCTIPAQATIGECYGEGHGRGRIKRGVMMLWIYCETNKLDTIMKLLF